MSGQPRTVLHAFSTFALGGAQARFVTLVNSFGPRYRHVVVSMDDQWATGERLKPNVQWERLPVENRKGRGMANRVAFRELLKRLRPDLLLSYNFGALEWAAANVPRVVPQWHVEDGFGPDEAKAQLPRRQWTRRALLGLAGIPLIVPSQRLAAVSRSWWVPTQRLGYIPNGVSVEHDAIARAAPQGRTIVIGTVAGLRPEKNLARLLQAFALARAQHDIRLVIVGDGTERAALLARAAELGIAGSVEFTGYLSNPQARLREFDLFALSSNTEQLPLAMLEAMALGIPVVSTSVGDVPIIVPQLAQACLSEPDDADFGRAMLRVLERRDDWRAWSQAGLDQVRNHYSEARMLEAWRQVFDGSTVLVAEGAGH